MANRHNTLLWMKDLIEHMTQCHDQLQWAADGRTESFLTDTLLVDVEQFQRLCEQLRAGKARSRTVLTTA